MQPKYPALFLLAAAMLVAGSFPAFSEPSGDKSDNARLSDDGKFGSTLNPRLRDEDDIPDNVPYRVENSKKQGKKYLTEKTDDDSLEEFRKKGCEIEEESEKITSLRCTDTALGAPGLEEDIEVFADDISADRKIGADSVWNAGYTGKGRMVAVIDTGIDYRHPELSDSYSGGYDFVNRDNDPLDDREHGTHVSGIITANGINARSKGVAPDAKILALKVLDESGSGYTSDIIRAIYYAVDGPDGIYNTSDDFAPDVISMSLGSSSKYKGADCDYASPSMAKAINYAVSKGIAVVASSGNSGTTGVSMPGCMLGAIAVGAVDKYDSRTSWSGTGYSLDIVAPGKSIYSTMPSSGYATKSGTSMAAPHVSGVVALIKEANHSISVAGIKDALYKTARDRGASGWDRYYGWGRVNASAALNYAMR